MTSLEAKNLLKTTYNLSDEIMNQLEEYAALLKEENEKYNLTAITDDVGIYIKHFYDSLLLAKISEFDPNKSIIDLGTGAGFPGLVLKICFPEMNVTLLDATKKRCDFLGIVVDKLGLKNVEIICSRIEELDDSFVEKYDFATARAVSKINILLELSSRIIKKDGMFIALRGATFIDESKETISCLKQLKLKQNSICSFELPENNGTRGIIVYKKEEITPKQFPRRYAQILKKPL